MPTTKQLNIKVDQTIRDQIAELAKLWSPVKPLTATDVVKECVRRVHQANTRRTAHGKSATTK